MIRIMMFLAVMVAVLLKPAKVDRHMRFAL